MNFQAVSVGQKLKIGGYIDHAATPSANLANTIAFVDRSIGQFVDALRNRGLSDKTLVIVSAKHGSRRSIVRSGRRSTTERSSPRRSAATSPSTSPTTGR